MALTILGIGLLFASPASAQTAETGAVLVTHQGVPRSVTNGVTTAGSTTVTSQTANFTLGDQGQAISGPVGGPIPAGNSIVTVVNSTTIVINTPATASATGVTLNWTGRVVPQGPQGSGVAFDIIPPPGAVCTGSTANGGFLNFSFLVDNSMVPDPGALTYNSAGPNAPALALTDTAGTPYGPANTTTGGGFTLPLPVFSFTPGFTGQFDPNGPGDGSGLPLYPGTFNIGLSCAVPSAGTLITDRFWNFQINLTANGTGGDFFWTLVPPPVTPEVPFAILLPLSALGISGIGVFVLRRRRPAARTARTARAA
jgi:hypothetical protein